MEEGYICDDHLVGLTFPRGLATLVPTIGAVLVVVCASPHTLAGKLLGHRLLVGIGLISYSAYLWHQPLFAFARYRMVFAPNQWLLGLLVALAFLLAWFSWKFVETPFRNASVHPPAGASLDWP